MKKTKKRQRLLSALMLILCFLGAQFLYAESMSSLLRYAEQGDVEKHK